MNGLCLDEFISQSIGKDDFLLTFVRDSMNWMNDVLLVEHCYYRNHFQKKHSMIPVIVLETWNLTEMYPRFERSMMKK